MRNKKLFKTAVLIAAISFSLYACGKQAEQVSEEPAEVVEEVETEESTEEVEEVPEIEESEEVPEVEETSENEVDTIEEEETTAEEGTTGIEIVEELDQMMYVQTSANARSGDSTDFDVVTTFNVNTEVHVVGRTGNDWFKVEQSDGDVYVSAKLLGLEKVVVQQSSGGGSSSTASNGGTGSEQSSSSNSGALTPEEQQALIQSIFPNSTNTGGQMPTAEEWYRSTYGDEAWEEAQRRKGEDWGITWQ